MAEIVDKGLVICADDYGLAPGIGRAVRALAKNNCISATSCMTTSPYWQGEAVLMKELKPDIELGLHLVLTDQPSLGGHSDLTIKGRFPTLAVQLKKALMKSLPVQAVRAEIELQIDVFKSATGRYPDYIDGHQHVHQFPVIRNCLIDVMRGHRELQNAWIRVCWESPWRMIKRRIALGRALSIGLFGYPLRRLAQANGFRTNLGFAGIYDIGVRPYDDKLLEKMIGPSINGTVIMCHPGFVDEALCQSDTLTDPREEEFRYLESRQFQTLLKNTRSKICLSKELF